jgi:indole-3-glycerol phosphate synthase
LPSASGDRHRGSSSREYQPQTIARGYEAPGAAAISVLTEATFFDGALDHLRRVREAVSIPVLRKDFLSTEFQCWRRARLAQMPYYSSWQRWQTPS